MSIDRRPRGNSASALLSKYNFIHFIPQKQTFRAGRLSITMQRPSPICPCSSVGRATMICSGGREFESQRAQTFFSLFLREPISFLGISLRRTYLVYLYNTQFLKLYTSFNMRVIFIIKKNLVHLVLLGSLCYK